MRFFSFDRKLSKEYTSWTLNTLACRFSFFLAFASSLIFIAFGAMAIQDVECSRLSHSMKLDKAEGDADWSKSSAMEKENKPMDEANDGICSLEDSVVIAISEDRPQPPKAFLGNYSVYTTTSWPPTTAARKNQVPFFQRSILGRRRSLLLRGRAWNQSLEPRMWSTRATRWEGCGRWTFRNWNWIQNWSWYDFHLYRRPS